VPTSPGGTTTSAAGIHSRRIASKANITFCDWPKPPSVARIAADLRRYRLDACKDMARA
jgi:hypothetical protein